MGSSQRATAYRPMKRGSRGLAVCWRSLKGWDFNATLMKLLHAESTSLFIWKQGAKSVRRIRLRQGFGVTLSEGPSWKAHPFKRPTSPPWATKKAKGVWFSTNSKLLYHGDEFFLALFPGLRGLHFAA